MPKKTNNLAGEGKVESWPINQVHEYPGNAKIHDEKQIKSIALSIQKFGFDVPIVVDGAGVIIKGHGRRLAAIHLEYSHVPVIVRTDMTAKEANASRIADNRVAVGDVDTNILNAEIMEIADSDTDDLMSAMGLTEKELDFMSKDLGDMDLTALAGDDDVTTENVSDAKSDSADAKGRSVPIKEVLGFGFFEAADAKIVARWLSTMRGEYDVDSAKVLACVAIAHFAKQ